MSIFTPPPPQRWQSGKMTSADASGMPDFSLAWLLQMEIEGCGPLHSPFGLCSPEMALVTIHLGVKIRRPWSTIGHGVLTAECPQKLRVTLQPLSSTPGHSGEHLCAWLPQSHQNGLRELCFQFTPSCPTLLAVSPMQRENTDLVPLFTSHLGLWLSEIQFPLCKIEIRLLPCLPTDTVLCPFSAPALLCAPAPTASF